MLGFSMSSPSSTWARVLFLQNNSKDIHQSVLYAPWEELALRFIVELLFLDFLSFLSALSHFPNK